MTWQVLNKVVRLSGAYAFVDIVIEKQNEQDPYVFAIVDEARDKAIIQHAKCDSMEEAKTMAIGALQMYESLINPNNANRLFVIEDGIILVNIRTDHGDRYEPLASGGEMNTQVQSIISDASLLFGDINKG
jgi:hypothetical protein